jgi:hypothetical protein
MITLVVSTQMGNDISQTTVTARDRRLVHQYLGAFLLASMKAGPNSAVADNMRRAAEAMVAVAREDGRREGARDIAERERCALIADEYAARAKEDRSIWAAEAIAAIIRGCK